MALDVEVPAIPLPSPLPHPSRQMSDFYDFEKFAIRPLGCGRGEGGDGRDFRIQGHQSQGSNDFDTRMRTGPGVFRQMRKF